MYRIRSASGAETVYPSLEEFTAAVRRGEVAPEDEIFHSRANRWLDVKSHPHFHNAANWSGPLSAGLVPSPAPARPPEPTPTPASPATHASSKPRPQVAEFPALSQPAPQQTVARPQLAPQAPAAASPAPAALPPPRSNEILYIDVGDPRLLPRQHAAEFEAPKQLPAPAAPKPTVAPPKEAEFLVMDTGLDRPVRASNGHLTVQGDVDMLFDTPLADAKPGAAASVVPAPEAAPKPAEPPKAQALQAPTLERTTPTPPARPSVQVAPIEHREREDLDIPGPPLLETPVVTFSRAPESGTRGGQVGMVVGSSAALMLAAGALLVWQPWGVRASGTAFATTRSVVTVPTAETPVVPSAEPVPVPATESAPVPAPAVPSRPGLAPLIIPKPTQVTARPDSAGMTTDEEIVPAARPDFGSTVPIPSSDLAADLEPTSRTPVVAPSEFTRRLEAAEKQAQLDLAGRLTGFRAVITPARLATAASVALVRAQWNGGAEAIRQYRDRIGRLEQAYQDSVLGSQRAQRWPSEEIRAWTAHQSRAEATEAAQLSDLMFAQVNEGLDLLAALDNQYEITGDVIRFRNPASVARYASIRSWVEQRRQAWSAIPPSARPLSVNFIMQALGDGFPRTQ
ncbi:MAG TPA: hypothetical protein VH879_12560 [Gemmatimonadales bacterium]|jgi:hypothetical protein